MPPREAKGRYLAREYMADAGFHRDLPDAASRELYLLLALFADDAGWLEWDPMYLTFTIYRYDQNPTETFEKGVAALRKSGRLKVLKCGHAEMPKVGNRPRGMAREYGVLEGHIQQCKSTKGASKKHQESSRPPNLTSPNLTSPVPIPEPSTPRGRARKGGAPQEVGEVVSDFRKKAGWDG